MKPIPGLERVRSTDEFLCYEVESLTDPTKFGPYRVDKSHWFGSGSCSCERFCCVIQPELGKGNWTGYDAKGRYIGTTCKHIQLADRWYSCMSARRAIEERVKLQPTYRYCPSEPNL